MLGRQTCRAYIFAGILACPPDYTDPSEFADGQPVGRLTVSATAPTTRQQQPARQSRASTKPGARQCSHLNPIDAFQKAVEGLASIADLKAALLGTKGPGAEPRRPDTR
jgi:hypothetical protein